MPGPPPKPRGLRQRMNRKPGEARVPAGARRRGRIPELFDRPCPCGGALEQPQRLAKRRRGRPKKPRPPCAACLGTGILSWHPLTMAWWRDTWTSEVATQYLQVDMHGLRRLAVLVDKYWKDSDAGMGVRELGAEIRLQQQSFGLTPLDRTRLGLEIQRPEPEEDAGLAASMVEPAGAGRSSLRAVK